MRREVHLLPQSFVLKLYLTLDPVTARRMVSTSI
jgi:hypothetical protein